MRNLGAETGVGQGQNVERETANSKRQNAIGSPKEVVNRYLRVDAGTRHERVRFMAVIDVDGVRYTTNYSHDDISFISYVTIGFVPPYRLWVSDLIQYDDQSAYDDFFAILTFIIGLQGRGSGFSLIEVLIRHCFSL